MRAKRLPWRTGHCPTGSNAPRPLWVYTYCHAGDQISIWIDQRGNRVDPPKTSGTMIAVGYGVLLLTGGWVLLGSLWGITCCVLDRINAPRWDLDWARTGPAWSRHTWQ